MERSGEAPRSAQVNDGLRNRLHPAHRGVISVFLTLLTLFVGVPLIELALLLWIGQYLGVFNTILVVVLTGVLGAWMARQQGFRVLREIQQQLQRGRIPGDSLVEGGLILAGGVTFLTPGFLTDFAGLLCLVPPTRRWLRERVKDWIRRRVNRGAGFWMWTGGSRFEKTIEYRTVEPEEDASGDESDPGP